MASKAQHRARSSNWMGIVAGLLFCTGAVFVLSGFLEETMGSALENQEPELAMPLSPIAFEREARPVPLSREEEDWQELALGSFSLQVPGSPRTDNSPGWFDRYQQVTRLHAYSLPVEHRQSHVRLSVIRYGKGRISLNAASLAAKSGLAADFPGVTTILPFDFRDLPARHLSTRPVDADDLTRLHTYLLINGQEMLILSVKGHDTHPNRLAHQILRTISLTDAPPVARPAGT